MTEKEERTTEEAEHMTQEEHWIGKENNVTQEAGLALTPPASLQ